MAATKECPSCGAKNDVIFTNCIFCKTSLPVTDNNSITNDELVMKATEWVGISADAQLEIRNPNATGLDRLIGGIRIMQRPEIIANAEKYLNILAIRSTSNPTLAQVYMDLKFKLDKNQKKVSSRTKILIGCLITLVICGVIIGFGIKGENKDKEKKRIENLKTQINNAVESKNYDYALVLTEQLRWEENPESNKEMVGEYDRQRQDLKKSIEKMKEDFKN